MKSNTLPSDRTIGQNMTPFLEAHDRLKAISNQLLEFENSAKKSLPGILWDFSILRAHVDGMADAIREGLPLKAWKAHVNFAITGAAAKLGSVKSERKRAAALAASRIAAIKVATGIVSERKMEASRQNLIKARRARVRKEWSRLDESTRKELRDLREKRRLLRQAINREGLKPFSNSEKIELLGAERDRLRKEIIKLDARADPSW